MAVGTVPQEVSIVAWSVLTFEVALVLELPSDEISGWLPSP